jgi:hypothetical protein
VRESESARARERVCVSACEREREGKGHQHCKHFLSSSIHEWMIPEPPQNRFGFIISLPLPPFPHWSPQVGVDASLELISRSLLPL